LGRSGVGIGGMRERLRQFEGTMNIESDSSGTHVKREEFDEAQKYSQRILEDFYDDRPTVEARLRSSGHIP
jgi:signal transduction histidine kinase